MRIVKLVFFLCFLESIGSFAQVDTSDVLIIDESDSIDSLEKEETILPIKSILKYDLLRQAWGVTLSIEKTSKRNDKTTIEPELIIGWMAAESYFFDYYTNNKIFFVDEYGSSTLLNIGFGVGLSLKKYFLGNKVGPRGAFVSVKMRDRFTFFKQKYINSAFSFFEQFLEEDEVKGDLLNKGFLNTADLSLSLGYSWVYRNRFTFEAFVGPGVSFNNFTYGVSELSADNIHSWRKEKNFVIRPIVDFGVRIGITNHFRLIGAGYSRFFW